MTSGDLFSFLDNDNDSDSEPTSSAMQVDSVTRTSPARALTSSNERSAVSSELQTRIKHPPPSPPPEYGPPSKRKRLDVPPASALAMVVDEFETEARREVAASVGFTGATETAGPRLELRHQVRLQDSFHGPLANCQF
jgi:ATP-dependent RNA helicase DOB1